MSQSTEVAPQQTGIQLRSPGDAPISDESLAEYGRQLQFDSKYLQKANEVVRKVTQCLKGCGPAPERFSVSETHVCQEGVDDTGVDVVAYVKESDRESCKSKFQEAIQQIGGKDISKDDKDVVHFTLDGVKVNLGISQSRGSSVREHRTVTLEQTAKRNKEGKLEKSQLEKVSVDLHDSMQEYMQKNKDEFDMAAERLARAWRQTALADWGDWFTPLDSVLVMQNALSRQRERGGRRQMRSIMQDYLRQLSDISNMSLTFPETSMYEWEMVPDWIRQQRPLLLDPVNPFRNVLQDTSSDVFENISRRANEALRILEKETSRMSELFNVPQEYTTRGA